MRQAFKIFFRFLQGFIRRSVQQVVTCQTRLLNETNVGGIRAMDESERL